MLSKLRFPLVCLLGLLAAMAHAATVSVGPGQAYTTIQAGINAANPGDTVLVAPGTYAENIDFKGKAITVKASGSLTATIIAGSPASGLASVTFQSGEQRSSVISGFTITGLMTPFQVTGAAGNGVYVLNSAPTIENNLIVYSSNFGVQVINGAALIQNNEITSTEAAAGVLYAGAAILLQGTNTAGVGGYTASTVVGNMIDHNNSGTTVGGIMVDSAEGTVIQSNNINYNNGYNAGGLESVNTVAISILQNLIYMNAAEGIIHTALVPEAGGILLNPTGVVAGVVQAPGPVEGVISGNTITGNQADSFSSADTHFSEVGLYGDLTRYVLVNNVIVGSSATYAALGCNITGNLSLTPLAFDHNDIYNSAAGGAVGSACNYPAGSYGNISADPLFVSASTGNYKLQAGSPAIDAGNNSVPLLPATDLATLPRIQNGSAKSYAIVDMGPYEFSGTTDLGHSEITLSPSEYFSSTTPTPAPPPLSFKVTLSAVLGQPTGYVALFEDGTQLVNVNVDTSGTATFTPTNLTSGTHVFTAVYPAPGSGFINPPAYETPAVSVMFYLIVPITLTNVTLASSQNPSAFGAPVTFTVMASSQTGGVPSPVTLTDSTTGTLLATLTPPGNTTFATSALGPGNHAITAAFAGNTNYGPASATLTQTVNPIPTASVLTIVSPASGVVNPGAPVTLTANVTHAATSAGNPNGTVTFYDGSAVIGTASLAASGAATGTFSGLPVGIGSVNCIYSGDANYGSSMCAGQPITVSLSEPVGTTSPTAIATVTFAAAGVLGSVAVLTQGAPNLDFKFVSGGTCAAGTAYTAGQSCTVDFTFTPKVPGIRYGGVTLTTATGAVLAEIYISGTGVGPQLNYLPGVQSIAARGFVTPAGIAFDGAGNLFVADYHGSQVKELLASSGYQTAVTIGSGWVEPVAVAIDGNGNLFVSENNSNPDVKEVMAVGGYTGIVTIGGGFAEPSGLAVDGNGNVFVADSSNNAVKEIVAAGGYSTVLTLGSGFSSPSGVAVDASGNVFVADYGHGLVKEIAAAGGYTTVTTLPGSYAFATDIAVSASGNLFLASGGASTLWEVFAAGGYATSQKLGTSVEEPNGIALDGLGNVFYADFAGKTIVKLDYADAPTLSFAATQVGATSSDSPQTVTITNNGTATLVMAAVTSGTNPSVTSGFVIGNSSTCTPLGSGVNGNPLVPGASCTNAISFVPVNAGVDAGKLTYIDNNLNVAGAVQIIPLNGTGNLAPPQTITFPPPPSPAFAGTSVTLTATASSGLPVTYSVISGPATVSGSTLTYTGGGTVVVEADQAGNAAYAAAAPVQDTVTVVALTEPVGTTSPTLTATLIFTAPGTLGTVSVLTQGALNLDYKLVAGGSCAVGTAYAIGQSCTVEFTFGPTHPGPRRGGIALNTSGGTLLANTYLNGTGTGPQVVYNPGTRKMLGSGLTQPSGIAVDGNGNLFVTNFGAAGLVEILAGSGAVRTIGSYTNVQDAAVDGSGNVFFLSSTTTLNEVLAVNGSIPASPTILTLATGFVDLFGLKVDKFGNVFMAGVAPGGGASAVQELLAVNGSIPATPTLRTLGSGSFSSLTGVAVDDNGNVFATDQITYAVYELLAVNGTVPASNATALTLTTGLNKPSNVVVDLIGNVFVTDYGDGKIDELFAVNGSVPVNAPIVTVASGFIEPQGLAIDGSGNIFVADYGYTQAAEVDFADAPTLTFAATTVGATSSDSPQTVTFTNDGNMPLGVGSYPPQNPNISAGFAIASSTCPVLNGLSGIAYAINPGNSCVDSISFKPVAVGAANGALNLVDNNLNVFQSTQTIPLIGVGAAPAPSIVFSVPNHTFGDPPFTVAATSNSTGAFTYSVVSGPATISGATVTLTGAGSVTLLASEAATANYTASTAQATFNVAKAAQAISFAAPASPVNLGVAPIALSATATSGLPVTFKVLSGPATVSGNLLTISGTGTVVVAADQAGNANFNAAPEVTRMVLVFAGTVSVTLAGAPNPVFVLNPVTFVATLTTSATVAPTGTVTFYDGGVSVGSAAAVGGVAKLAVASLAFGPHTITAAYSGDGNFAAGTSAAIAENVQDFSLTATGNTSQTVVHGNAVTYTFAIASLGGATTPAAIGFRVNGEPYSSKITFTPATYAAGSASGTLSLTMVLPDYPSPAASLDMGSQGRPVLALVGLGGLLLLFRRRDPRRHRLLRIGVLLLAGVGAALGLNGCGSGWGTSHYTVTVTASSGPLAHAASVAMTEH